MPLGMDIENIHGGDSMLPTDLPFHGAGEVRPDFPDVVSMFDYAVANAADAPALTHLGRTITYGEEALAAAGLAQRLANIGAGKGIEGQTVALLLPNSIEYHVAYFATLMARGVPTLLNPLYPPTQLEPLLRDSEPRILICEPSQRSTLIELTVRMGKPDILDLGDSGAIDVRALIKEGTAGRPNLDVSPDLPAALLHTGGTTGIPKGVEHSHAAIMAAVRCMEWGWPTRAREEVWLPITPMFHIYGLLMGVLNPVYGCGHVVVPERFSPEIIVKALADHRITIFGGGPPSIYAAVLSASNLASADLSALRVCPAGAAPLPVELIERWHRATGLHIYEGLGMTEMSPIAVNTETYGRKAGSVGKPVPCNTVQIVDLENGTQVLPTGVPGEIRVTGPQAMKGYRGGAAKPGEGLRNGFIYTGDIGYLDEDGFLVISDRKKDVILVKGFNVFPREVEEVLNTHPGVVAAGVIGIADDRDGERILAFVTPQNDTSVSEPELRALCAKLLVPYKHPREYRFITELPLTAAKKLDRIRLREMSEHAMRGASRS
jgi:long-chain acyl-CoA synthetase